MEPITLAAISAFFGACLYKAGEKVSEKTIELIFENKKELADSFTGLFKEEIISLGLNDVKTLDEARRQLEARPEIAIQALEKLSNKPELLREFNELLREQTAGMTINADKIGQVIKDNHGTINQNVNF